MRIDDERRPEGTIGLKARDRIGTKPLLETKLVSLTGPHTFCRDTEVAGTGWRHRYFCLAVEHQRYFTLRRCPHSEDSAIRIDNRTERWL
jgi:hypothetical protein